MKVTTLINTPGGVFLHKQEAFLSPGPMFPGHMSLSCSWCILGGVQVCHPGRNSQFLGLGWVELQVEFSARGNTSYVITPRSKGELVSHYGHVTALPRMVASNVLITDSPWDAAVYYL